MGMVTSPGFSPPRIRVTTWPSFPTSSVTDDLLSIQRNRTATLSVFLMESAWRTTYASEGDRHAREERGAAALSSGSSRRGGAARAPRRAVLREEGRRRLEHPQG